MTTDPVLERIAAALERLAPAPPPAADPLGAPTYVWRQGRLIEVPRFHPLPLSALRGIDRQKAMVVETMRRLARGHAAHDVLLWGARGSGKSALVKSAAGAVQAEGGVMALVEASPAELISLPGLFARLAGVDRAFALFVDDLGFDAVGEARQLRSLLDGGAEARPANVRLFVTSNRRHLVPRDHADRDAINPRDIADDSLALADRFGLSLGFHAVDQEGYLDIVAGYAAAHDLAFDAAEAIAWATQRGGRSGRVAWQFIAEIAGRAGRPVE